MYKRSINWLNANLTILKWISGYTREQFKGDAMAGFSVGFILIPQSMAYALLAGVPPIYGLYASVIPLMIYPLFGSSRHLAVGVVAIDMLVVAAGVSTLAPENSEQYIALAILLSFMAGVIQISMSVAKLGFIVNLLSKPVIIGFTAAAPLIIAISQLGNLVGVDQQQAGHIINQFIDVAGNLDQVHLVTAAVGLGSIALILVVKKFHEMAPEALIIVVSATLVAWLAGLEEMGVELVGAVPGGFPTVQVPSAELEQLRRLLPTAITLALIQFMNITTLGRTFASKHNYSIYSNRELFAMGSANIMGGFFRGLPISGSFSRSAINEQAGAKTPLANVFAGLLVLIALFILTPLLYHIPMAALAAVIIVAAVSLIDIHEVQYLFRTKERDGYIALFTFGTTLLIGIQEGILLGVSASLVAVLIRASRPNVAVLGHVEGSRFFRDVERFPEAQQIEGILVLRVDASFSFNNAEYFKDFILEKSEKAERPIKALIIDGMSINDLDTTAIEALSNVMRGLEELKIDLHFAGLKGPIRDIMLRSGLARKLGGTHFHMTPDRAVRYILEKWKKRAEDGEGDERLSTYLSHID